MIIVECGTDLLVCGRLDDFVAGVASVAGVAGLLLRGCVSGWLVEVGVVRRPADGLL